MSQQELSDPNDESWWFNTHTKEVERGRVSPGADRIGPYKSYAEATDALEILQERSRAWAAEEAEEDNWGTD